MQHETQKLCVRDGRVLYQKIINRNKIVARRFRYDRSEFASHNVHKLTGL
jgi:hypothetical protein